MKQYFLTAFIFLLFFVSSSFCQIGQSSQTLHDVYTIEPELTQLILDLGDSKIEIRNTNASRLSVETVVIVGGLSNEKMLNFLVEQGRYALSIQKDLTSSTISITNNKNRNVLMVKGQQCQEDFTYIVYIPHSIKTVQNKSNLSTSAQLTQSKK